MSSSDGQDAGGNPVSAPPHRRQASIPPATSSLSSLFQRRNSLAAPATTAGTGQGVYPSPAAAMTGDLNHRRRLSVTTGIGLSGTSPTTSYFRRGSMSTNPDSIDEHAVDEDDPTSASQAATSSGFPGRLSFGGWGGVRTSVSGPSSGASDQLSFDWNDQLQYRARARAQSSVIGARPFFSTSPPNPAPAPAPVASMVEPVMPAPPTQPVKPVDRRPKPDPFQERILKGDFYMD